MVENITYKLRVTLHGDPVMEAHGFGHGIELLLLGIEQFGSLNRAAKELGMAYSKAWSIIRVTEREFALQLIDRDGAHGSTLTEPGRDFLARYQAMIKEADQAVAGAFNKYFSLKTN